jgi:hypothetical protein
MFLLAAALLTLATATADAKPRPKPRHNNDRPPRTPVMLKAAVSAGSVTLSWRAQEGDEDE